VEQFVGPYKIKAIISSNIVELELLPTIKIHLVVNVSRRPEERNATACGNRRGRGGGGRENTEQEEGMREGQVFGMMERIHGRGRHLGK